MGEGREKDTDWMKRMQRMEAIGDNIRVVDLSSNAGEGEVISVFYQPSYIVLWPLLC